MKIVIVEVKLQGKGIVFSRLTKVNLVSRNCLSNNILDLNISSISDSKDKDVLIISFKGFIILDTFISIQGNEKNDI